MTTEISLQMNSTGFSVLTTDQSRGRLHFFSLTSLFSSNRTKPPGKFVTSALPTRPKILGFDFCYRIKYLAYGAIVRESSVLFDFFISSVLLCGKRQRFTFQVLGNYIRGPTRERFIWFRRNFENNLKLEVKYFPWLVYGAGCRAFLLRWIELSKARIFPFFFFHPLFLIDCYFLAV